MGVVGGRSLEGFLCAPAVADALRIEGLPLETSLLVLAIRALISAEIQLVQDIRLETKRWAIILNITAVMFPQRVAPAGV